jgi:hypothetical protein
LPGHQKDPLPREPEPLEQEPLVLQRERELPELQRDRSRLEPERQALASRPQEPRVRGPHRTDQPVPLGPSEQVPRVLR